MENWAGLNVRDAVGVSMFLITLCGIAIQVAISIALAKRDRQDMKELRSDHDALERSVASLREQVAEMRGEAKAKGSSR